MEWPSVAGPTGSDIMYIIRGNWIRMRGPNSWLAGPLELSIQFFFLLGSPCGPMDSPTPHSGTLTKGPASWNHCGSGLGVHRTAHQTRIAGTIFGSVHSGCRNFHETWYRISEVVGLPNRTVCRGFPTRCQCCKIKSGFSFSSTGPLGRSPMVRGVVLFQKQVVFIFQLQVHEDPDPLV